MAQQPHFGLVEVTPPAIEPVTLTYCKQWLRIDADEHDAQLLDLITMARQLCGEYCGRSFVNTQYQMVLDRPPLVPNSQYAPGNPNILAPVLQNVWPLDPSIWAIKLPRSPVQSVDLFAYIDANGNQQTMPADQYILDSVSEPSRISPSSGSYWPSVQWRPNAVTITFTAGYGSTVAAVPAKFRMAIVATVGWFYDNPDGTGGGLPDGVKAILDADRVREVW
jgi:hypothetical protein